MTVHYLILHNQLVATQCQSRWFWDNAKSYKCLDSRVMLSVIELYPRTNYKDLKTDKNKNFFKTDICQEKNMKISINPCCDKKNLTGQNGACALIHHKRQKIYQNVLKKLLFIYSKNVHMLTYLFILT